MTQGLWLGAFEECASHLNALRPDEDAFERWVGALGSGEFKHGHHLLKDGDGALDPFGVLATISGLDFAWDEDEDAYAVDGDCYILKPATVADCLGIRHHTAIVDGGMYDWINDFIDLIHRVNDGAIHFEPTYTLLKQGAAHAARQRANLSAMKMSDLHPRYGRDQYDATPVYHRLRDGS